MGFVAEVDHSNKLSSVQKALSVAKVTLETVLFVHCFTLKVL